MRIVQDEIFRAKEIVKNVFSMNYLLPIIDKSFITDIKSRLESRFSDTKLIVYEPQHPRKNISLTLLSTYKGFQPAYEYLRNSIDDQNLFSEKFEHY